MSELREIQRPIKERYRSDPESSRIRLTARGFEVVGPMACSVEVGQAIARARAQPAELLKQYLFVRAIVRIFIQRRGIRRKPIR